MSYIQQCYPNGPRHAALVNSARDILWEFDPAGKYTFISLSIEQVLGYRPRELLGCSPIEMVTAPQRAGVRQILRDAMIARAPLTLMQCTIIAKSGGTVEVETNGAPFFNAKGEFCGYRGVTRDITERCKLSREQQRLAALVDSASDAIMSKDLDNRITSWNKGAERMFGYPAAEAVGRHVSFMAPPDRKHEAVALTARMVDGGHVENHRTVRMHKDGHLVDVLISYAPIKDEYGTIVGTSAIAKDITTEISLQTSLASQTALLQTVNELSPDGILAVGADGVIGSYNRRFLEIWGIPEDVATRGLDVEFLHAARKVLRDPDGFMRRVDYLYAHDDVTTFDEVEFKDGRIIVRYTAPTKDPSGTYLGRLWFFRDITAQRRAQEEAKASLRRFGASMLSTVEALANTTELRDPYTAGHQRRVSEIAVAIGRKLALNEHETEGVRIAALLHDIGKITVPAEILAKPGRLKQVEYDLIKGHVQGGYDILKGIDFDWPVAEMVYQHHERFDGSGYPRGLKGDEILLGGRILAVADTMEAMMSHRPYRPGLGVERALAEIERGRGQIYDPTVADACKALFAEGTFTFSR